MSKPTVGEALIARLADWGVDTVFGLPGDGINGIMEGLRRNADRVRFVLVHHEEAAAFMAIALRQGHRPARRLPGHLRARRHPPGQRALRREARPRAGAGDHRHAGDQRARHRRTSRRSTSTGCSPTWPSTTR